MERGSPSRPKIAFLSFSTWGSCLLKRLETNSLRDGANRSDHYGNNTWCSPTKFQHKCTTEAQLVEENEILCGPENYIHRSNHYK